VILAAQGFAIRGLARGTFVVVDDAIMAIPIEFVLVAALFVV